MRSIQVNALNRVLGLCAKLEPGTPPAMHWQAMGIDAHDMDWPELALHFAVHALAVCSAIVGTALRTAWRRRTSPRVNSRSPQSKRDNI